MTTLALPQVKGHDVLTHSRMATQKTCARKHYYRYELGVRKEVGAQPLRMGGSIHLGLDLRARGEDQDAAISAAVRDYEVVPAWAGNDEALADWFVERETVATMLAGYYWRWSESDVPGGPDPLGVKRVLASEIAFNIPIRNPETGKATPTFTFAGKIDKIVELNDGRVAVMEHKSAGEDIGVASDYWARLRLDQQISGYFVAGKELGYDIQTVLYDVLRKPSIAPSLVPILDDNGLKIVLDAEGKRVLKENILKSGKPGAGHGEPRQSADKEKGQVLQQRRETAAEFGARFLQDITARPDFYYARRDIPRLDSDLAEFRWELWQQQQSIRDSQRLGRWFRNTGACLTMGRCEYLDICHNGLSEVPPGFVRVDDLHPELASGDDQ